MKKHRRFTMLNWLIQKYQNRKRRKLSEKLSRMFTSPIADIEEVKKNSLIKENGELSVDIYADSDNFDVDEFVV